MWGWVDACACVYVRVCVHLTPTPPPIFTGNAYLHHDQRCSYVQSRAYRAPEV